MTLILLRVPTAGLSDSTDDGELCAARRCCKSARTRQHHADDCAPWCSGSGPGGSCVWVLAGCSPCTQQRCACRRGLHGFHPAHTFVQPMEEDALLLRGPSEPEPSYKPDQSRGGSMVVASSQFASAGCWELTGGGWQDVVGTPASDGDPNLQKPLTTWWVLLLWMMEHRGCCFSSFLFCVSPLLLVADDCPPPRHSSECWGHHRSWTLIHLKNFQINSIKQNPS